MSWPTHEQVWPRLQAFVEANSNRRRIRERLGVRLGTGGGKIKALLLLDPDPLPHSVIAEALKVDRPYATVIVNQLEELGLAERRPDPDDGRRKLVALTDTGRQVVEEVRQVLDVPPPALARLSPQELDQLAAIVAKLEG